MATEFFDKIGDNTFIYPSVEVYVENRQQDGRGLYIGSNCLVFPRTRFVLGDMFSNKSAGLEIGNDVQIGPGCYISAEGGVSIGQFVLVGANVNILSSSYEYRETEIPVRWQGMVYGKVIIGDDVAIGAGAVILKDVRVGRGAIIAAGSVVINDIPDYGVVAGNPARLIKFRGDEGLTTISRLIRKFTRFFSR